MREHWKTESKKMKELEAQIAELEMRAEKLRAEIKIDMENKGLEEMKTPNFIIRWKEVVSNRLDGKALKAALPDVYGRYVTQTASKAICGILFQFYDTKEKVGVIW